MLLKRLEIEKHGLLTTAQVLEELKKRGIPFTWGNLRSYRQSGIIPASYRGTSLGQKKIYEVYWDGDIPDHIEFVQKALKDGEQLESFKGRFRPSSEYLSLMDRIRLERGQEGLEEVLTEGTKAIGASDILFSGTKKPISFAPDLVEEEETQGTGV